MRAAPGVTRMSRARLTLVFQLALSAALLVLLARRVPIEESFALLMGVPPGTLAIATGLSLVGYLGRAKRWSALLERGGVRLPARPSYVLTLVGTGYGLLTPGRVGEFARALHLRGSRADSAPSVVWDRIADVLLLELMALPAFLFIPAWREHLLAGYAVFVALSLVAVGVLDRPALLGRLAERWPWLHRVTRGWRAQSARMLGSREFRVALAGGTFFYLFSYLAAYLLLRQVAPGAPLLLLLALPVIPFLGNLPVAFGGLGLREHVSASVFAQLGVAASAGPAFSLLWFTTATLVPGLIGLALAATPLAHWRPATEAEQS